MGSNPGGSVTFFMAENIPVLSGRLVTYSVPSRNLSHLQQLSFLLLKANLLSLVDGSEHTVDIEWFALFHSFVCLFSTELISYIRNLTFFVLLVFEQDQIECLPSH